MNTTFKVACSALIIILITLLGYIYISYYNAPVEVPVNNIPYNTPVVVKEPIEQKDMIVSTDEKQETKVEVPTTEKVVTPVIVSSETKTSDKEKQQILSQIDKTLNDLLEIVDKVPTVDESKLEVDVKEVQP